MFTLFLFRFYPVCSSLCITPEIPCRWLGFLPKAIVLDGSHPAHGVGYDCPSSPRKCSLLLDLPIVKETSWQLWCIYNVVQLALPSLCYINTNLSPSAEKFITLWATGKSSTWMCVVGGFQGRDRVEGSYCVRNLPECHSCSKWLEWFEQVEQYFLQGSSHPWRRDIYGQRVLKGVPRMFSQQWERLPCYWLLKECTWF